MRNDPELKEDEPSNDDQIDELVAGGENKYLIFFLGNETYGTPLISVRQVIEYHAPKPVPNMADSFEGVINIRGEIIGVINLKKFLGVAGALQGKSQLIFDTDHGPLAAVVDRVEEVATIRQENIEKNPNLKTRTPTQFFIGVGKVNDQLVNLIQLDQLLSIEELIATKIQTE